MIEMRRKDREITDTEEIVALLEKCDIIRIGLADGDVPYVVPMNFGVQKEDGKIAVYLHAAKEGRKKEIWTKNPNICVEADRFYRVERNGEHDITTRYESVIGNGVLLHLEGRDEKVAGLKVILDHYAEGKNFQVTSCTGLSNVEVYKVILDEVRGKKNMPTGSH